MKKIVWIIISVVVIGYFVNSHMENKARREVERAETQRVEQIIKDKVSQMVARTDAIRDWEATLSKGENVRFEPILTVELERLWLHQRPILFIGSIKDIATHNQSKYMVVLEKSLFSSFDYMFMTELQLSLLCDKNVLDSFTKKHPELFKDLGLQNGVAVVARINSIRSTYVIGEEGEREELKIGNGELLEIVYTMDVLF